MQACIAAKIAKGEIVHLEAWLIRTDVSWDSLAVRHMEAVSAANENAEARKSRKTGKFKKVCVTDPDATMATNARNRRLEPPYKQHAVVDDVRGVVLDIVVTTGEINEGQLIVERIDAAERTMGLAVRTVTADAGYAYAKMFAAFENRGIDALIPAKAEPIRSPVPLRRFRCQARHPEVHSRQGPAPKPHNKRRKQSGLGSEHRAGLTFNSQPDPAQRDVAGSI